MIKEIVAVPKYAARLVPPGEDVKEVSASGTICCHAREPGEGTAIQGHGLDERIGDAESAETVLVAPLLR